MDYGAVNWALTASVKPSASAHVLLALACRANKEFLCFPSIPRLVADTGLNRKTIIKSLSQLLADGWLVNTGDRCGRTGQTKVYRLAVTKIQQEAEDNTPKKGGIAGGEPPEKLSTGTNIGTVKDTQKRDCLTPKSTKNGTLKESQKRYSESLSSLNSKKENYPPLLNTETWQLWIKYRKQKGQRDYLPMEQQQVWNLMISLGDKETQMLCVQQAIQKQWKHIRPLETGGGHDGKGRHNSGDIFSEGTAGAFANSYTNEDWKP